MTKRLLIVLLNLAVFFFFTKISAQTVPNGGFENWSQSTYLIPDVVPPTGAFSSSNQQSFADANVLTLSKIANGAGSAMRIETKSYMRGSRVDTAIGFAIWGNQPHGGGAPVITGGFPFTDTNVTAMKVDLRYNINPLSPGLVLIQFKKNGVPIGSGNAPFYIPGLYAFAVSGTQSTFTNTTFNISPSLNTIPDSCAIGFTSSNPFNNQNGIPGSYMEIDSIMFTGTSQTVPAGNLDSWVNSPPIERLVGWNFDDNSIDYKTTDTNSGNFAIALPVLSGNNGPNNNNVARATLGRVIYSTGPNVYIPGMAVTGNPQSIGFFYKYSTPGIDTASVYVRLTKWNGTSRDDVGGTYMFLYPQSNYGYVFSQMQYQNALIADSAFIEFDASNDYSTSVIGSLLKVDDVRLNYCNEALTITGSNSVCANSSGLTYTVQGTPLSTYSWTTPAGSNITAGGTTDTITLNYGSTAGQIMVIKSYADGCPDDTASLSVAIQATATANAGLDESICANGTAALNASVTGAAGGSWSGGTGTFSPNNATLAAVYTPSAIEKALGSVTLTVTTTGNGSCSSANDNMTITITAAPTVNAGSDQTKCSSNDMTTLSGSFTTATGATWSGGAGSFSPDANTLTATYTPSASEVASGSVVLILSTDPGACPSVSDQMTISIDKAPTADAGPDQTICMGSSAVLNGSVTNATATWSTSGTGVFSNPNALNTVYIPSAADVAASSVTILLTTGTNGTCSSTSDQMTLTISTCTGITNSTSNNEMKIYPSPSSSIVNIELKSATNIAEVTVMNTMSQDVHARVLEINGNKATVDMSGLNSGMYLIRVSDGQSTSLQKVIKE